MASSVGDKPPECKAELVECAPSQVVVRTTHARWVAAFFAGLMTSPWGSDDCQGSPRDAQLSQEKTPCPQGGARDHRALQAIGHLA